VNAVSLVRVAHWFFFDVVKNNVASSAFDGDVDEIAVVVTVRAKRYVVVLFDV